jgi:hypothetical protein
MNEKMNNVFVKYTKGANPIRYYYPASIEYGFITRSGRKTTGKRYMRSASDHVKDDAQKVMISVLANEIDKLR